MNKWLVALSVRQPWAWLIVNGYKDVENRRWPTKYRGPVLIHASKAKPPGAVLDHVEKTYRVKIPRDGLKLGGVVGEATIVDCVESHPSKWFLGPFAFVLANSRQLPFKALPGKLKFFHVQADEKETRRHDADG